METTNAVKRVSRSSRGSSSQLILQDLLMFSSSLTSLSGPADKHHRSLMLPPPCVAWRWCVCGDVQCVVFSKHSVYSQGHKGQRTFLRLTPEALLVAAPPDSSCYLW